MRIKATALGTLAGVALLAAGALEVEAQTTLGVRGGISVSSASLDIGDTFDKSNRTGFVGGVFLDHNSGGLFGYQVGLQYNQKGAELDFGDAVDDFSVSYLEIPAVLKLGLPLGMVRPSVFGGAALGFKTGCDFPDDEDCDDLKGVEWSAVFGADVAFYLGGISLWVDGRYHVGLNNLSDSVDIDELKNRAWAFQGGIGFPLGG